MVRSNGSSSLDWERFARTIKLAVRFLDDVIEVNHWPSLKIASICRANRKIGLGVMGFAEMLMLLGIPYGSGAAESLAEELAQFLSERALAASEELARERGEFPNWGRSVYAARGLRLRNATRTSIAPTGSISIIAGTSAGIEPLFALAYRRENVLEGQTLAEVNPLLLRHLSPGADPERLAAEIWSRGSITGIPGIPQETRSLFRTALELSPEDHLRVQAAFQRHVDNAVSKTVNLPESATPEEIRATYERAWALKVKGSPSTATGARRARSCGWGRGKPRRVTSISPVARRTRAGCDGSALMGTVNRAIVAIRTALSYFLRMEVKQTGRFDGSGA